MIYILERAGSYYAGNGTWGYIACAKRYTDSVSAWKMAHVLNCKMIACYVKCK